MNTQTGFFNDPNKLSFKDILAIIMVAPFIVSAFLYLYHLMIHQKEFLADILEYMKMYIPVIVVVLGGYFGQEVASSYFTRGQTMGYGMYSYGSTMYPVSSTTTTAAQPNVPV